ncbi:MAG: sigma-70 family RNA polymerase sigma factor [Opitutaceae bacterium]
MSDDAELLRLYASDKSEEAFAELVRQHLGFVYHTALRHLDGDVHGAKDVAQTVFIDLARKAPSLVRRPFVAGWLHTSTRYAALHYRRTERRRQTREQEAHLMQELTREMDPHAEWERLRPVIDEALHALNPGDREVILMRYFEGRGFAEIGVRLKLSEDGARSRLERVLVKMETLLARRGVTSTAGALSIALAGQSAAAAPVGLASTITNVALSGATVISTASALTLGTLLLMKITSVALVGSLALNGVLGVLQMQENLSATSLALPSASLAEAEKPFNAASIYDPDPAAFLGKLRAAGVSDRVQRALIEAEIDAQFDGREKALLPSKPAVGWWQWQDKRVPLKTNLALLDLQREKTQLRLRLLGPDPAVIALDSADNPIAPEKREMLKLITEDYRAMLASLQVSPVLPAEREQIRLVEEQRKRDLAELLTPEELAAYETRNWKEFPSLLRQLRSFDATDGEFAAIRKSREQIMTASAATGSMTAGDMQAEEDRVRAARGVERFEAYDRSRRPEFQDLQHLLDRSGMSRDLAVSVYELWKGIEAESHRINADTTLSRAEGLAALKHLAERTRTGILERLGPEVGAAYLKRAHWISVVDNGGIITFTPGGWGGGLLGRPTTPSPRLGEAP